MKFCYIGQEELKCIELFLMDVDGVLTDGRIVYDDDGCETKQFSVKDGLGIRLLMEAGISVGVVTARCSGALTRRCTDLGINYLFDSVENKADALEELLRITSVSKERTAFVGDDLPDLPAMTRVGFPFAVADADKKVLEAASLITSSKGGCGAIRELAEFILKAKGVWNRVIEQFYR